MSSNFSDEKSDFGKMQVFQKSVFLDFNRVKCLEAVVCVRVTGMV
jgi:hypothetical protein